MRQMLSALTAVIILGVSSVHAETYQAQTACEKELLLWKSIEDSEYNRLPQWSGLEVLNLIKFSLPWGEEEGREFMDVTMTRESDEMPKGRLKHVHTYGAVAPIRFTANENSAFTGLFSGVECGLIRLSLAARPIGAITPGVALKFLIDSRPSANFMAMHSFDEQSSYNFFKHDFSNFVPEPQNGAIKILGKVFALVTSDPTKVDVSFMANVQADGTPVPAEERVAPYQLYLVPNRLQLNFSDSAHEVREDYSQIAPGTILYTVSARQQGSNQTVEIGHIETKDRFIASSYGDKRLFFRHENIDDN